MKAILYMAMTVNGLIAKEDDDTSFVSALEWKSFSSMIKQAGHMIIGRRTYDIMAKEGGFSKIADAKIIVMTLQLHYTVAKIARKT